MFDCAGQEMGSFISKGAAVCLLPRPFSISRDETGDACPLANHRRYGAFRVVRRRDCALSRNKSRDDPGLHGNRAGDPGSPQRRPQAAFPFRRRPNSGVFDGFDNPVSRYALVSTRPCGSTAGLHQPLVIAPCRLNQEPLRRDDRKRPRVLQISHAVDGCVRSRDCSPIREKLRQPTAACSSTFACSHCV